MNKEDEKVLEISARSFEEFKEDSLEKMEEFEEGKGVAHSVSFEDPTKLRKVLTEKRMELIQFLMSNQVESISGLSEKLDRGVKEVGKDVRLLEDYGIVRVEKQGRSKRPSVPYQSIEIEIGIGPENHEEKVEDRSAA
ncbi:MAG: transcriptional regulator [Candidatus Nanohaloarchaea archaeon]